MLWSPYNTKTIIVDIFLHLYIYLEVGISNIQQIVIDLLINVHKLKIDYKDENFTLSVLRYLYLTNRQADSKTKTKTRDS